MPVIDEYLVKLGSVVDQSGMQRFHQALREASVASEVSATAIAGSFFKAQTEIVGGFASISSAALGMVDKVAMADQSYRLLALDMHITKEGARGLKVTMDALGASLGQLTWDPELRARAQQLIADQRAMAPNGDFDAQMKKVRDIRFEFTRMEVEGEYLAMHVAEDFMKALGVGPDELLGKLQKFNNWVTHNLPQISNKLVTMFMPVWMDVKDVAAAVGEALSAAGLAFTNIVGLLTGDTSIEGTQFSFEKLATAIGYVVHTFAVFAEAIANVESLLAHLVGAIALLASGDFSGAGQQLGAAFHDVTAKAVGGIVGGVGGGVIGGALSGAAVGSFAGPIGTGIGALVGGGAGALGGFALGSNVGDGLFGGTGSDVHALIDKYSKSLGVDPRLAHAIAHAESGEQQFDASGNVKRSYDPTSSARGVFQLLSATAKSLGVDASSADGNVKGGVTLLGQLLHQYGGNVPEAVAAYHEGAPKMNAILAGRATLSPEARAEVAGVMRSMGAHGDVHVGSIVVHVDKPNATNADVGNAVAAKVRGLQNKRIQRNLAEFQDLSWSS